MLFLLNFFRNHCTLSRELSLEFRAQCQKTWARRKIVRMAPMWLEALFTQPRLNPPSPASAAFASAAFWASYLFRKFDL